MRTRETLFALLLCPTFVFNANCFGANGDYDVDPGTGDQYTIDPSRSIFPLDLIKNPERPRSYFLSPLLTFLLPGFDQLLESQLPQADTGPCGRDGDRACRAALVQRLQY